MAYVDRHSPQTRGSILASVAIIHVVVIYGVATGLSDVLPPMFERQPTKVYNVPLPKPSPPTPADPIDKVATKPLTQADPIGPVVTTFVNSNAGGVEVTSGVGELLPHIEPIVVASPTPTPVPVFTPKLARPRSDPGLWVSANDYPSADLRAEREGTTRFSLSIGTDGKVLSCEILASSGSASLDSAACAKLKQRGRFTPATDSSGATVPGTYTSAVKWTIPKE